MKHNKYSHLGGAGSVPLDIQNEVEQAIAGVTVKPARGAAEKIRVEFIRGISAQGWTGEMPVA